MPDFDGIAALMREPGVPIDMTAPTVNEEALRLGIKNAAGDGKYAPPRNKTVGEFRAEAIIFGHPATLAVLDEMFPGANDFDEITMAGEIEMNRRIANPNNT